jgi:hypothetical protein
MKNQHVALVVGNGKSRAGINLDQLLDHVTVIGCNAIHRDHEVDHLVCCDKRMVSEALNESPTQQCPIYTRERYYRDFKKILKFKRVCLLPDLPYQGDRKQDQPEHWGSGPYAVLLSAVLNFKTIILLGFDLYSETDYVNNIYTGTQNYSKVTTSAVDYTFWIYQINKVFLTHSDKKFIIVNNDNWKMPKDWYHDNVQFVNTDKFYNTIDLELNSMYNNTSADF